jgi:hypothetical protein
MTEAVIAYHEDMSRWQPNTRERLTGAAMAATMAAVLRQREVAEPAASLAAEAGAIAFKTAYLSWVTNPGGPDLAGLIRAAFGQLQAMAVPAVPAGRGRWRA